MSSLARARSGAPRRRCWPSGGEQVRILSRRGIGPEHPAIERVAADAADADRLSSLIAAAAALYNCANPPYHRWLSDWPPLASALLAASERTEASMLPQR